MNKKVNQDFLIRLKGAYQAKYGMEMDDWTAVILYELSEQFEGYQKMTQESANQILKASEHIKGQVYPVHFTSEKQALYYGFGKNLPYAVASCVIGVLMYIFMSSLSWYHEQQAFMDKYPNSVDFKGLIEHGNVVVIQGQKCLILRPNLKEKSPIKVGKEYVYDRNKKRVIVPLGK
jgi:hypothetical protein